MKSFDPIVWQQETGIEPDEQGASLIVGPTDVANLISERSKLRELGFAFGESTPADVFLFSVGEGPERACTKVGGLPYLHRSDRWPTDSNHTALPFVAQMDFRDSMDIVEEVLPGELLLIFGDLPSDDDETDLILLWKEVTTDRGLVSPDELPVQANFDCFSAQRWRTSNYPNAYADPRNDRVVSSPGVDSIYACEIFATQISQTPFMLARHPESMSEKVLCCFAPILPANDGPYPFCNVPESLLEITRSLEWVYDDRYQYVPQWLTWGDSTSLYILQNADGSYSHEFIIG